MFVDIVNMSDMPCDLGFFFVFLTVSSKVEFAQDVAAVETDKNAMRAV